MDFSGIFGAHAATHAFTHTPCNQVFFNQEETDLLAQLFAEEQPQVAQFPPLATPPMFPQAGLPLFAAPPPQPVLMTSHQEEYSQLFNPRKGGEKEAFLRANGLLTAWKKKSWEIQQSLPSHVQYGSQERLGLFKAGIYAWFNEIIAKEFDGISEKTFGRLTEEKRQYLQTLLQANGGIYEAFSKSKMTVRCFFDQRVPFLNCEELKQAWCDNHPMHVFHRS